MKILKDIESALPKNKYAKYAIYAVSLFILYNILKPYVNMLKSGFGGFGDMIQTAVMKITGSYNPSAESQAKANEQLANGKKNAAKGSLEEFFYKGKTEAANWSRIVKDDALKIAKYLGQYKDTYWSTYLLNDDELSVLGILSYYDAKQFKALDIEFQKVSHGGKTLPTVLEAELSQSDLKKINHLY